jgi:hypothetical protein
MASWVEQAKVDSRKPEIFMMELVLESSAPRDKTRLPKRLTETWNLRCLWRWVQIAETTKSV